MNIIIYFFNYKPSFYKFFNIFSYLRVVTYFSSHDGKFTDENRNNRTNELKKCI